MSPLWMIILGIEALSLAALCLGILLYRHIIMGNRVFIHSLQHTEVQMHAERMGFLSWFYVIGTIVLSVLIPVALYLFSPLV